MAIIGTPRKFFDRFSFIVDIDGVGSAAFTTATGLQAEAAVVEHSEGGVLTPFKSPGRVTFAPVVLTRGATSDIDLLNWFEEVLDAIANAGLAEPSFRRNADIVQTDRAGATLERWRLADAWPSIYTPGEWDNTADEKRIESVTLQHQGFRRVAA